MPGERTIAIRPRVRPPVHRREQLNATKRFPGYDMERTRIKVMMMRVDVDDEDDVPVIFLLFLGYKLQRRAQGRQHL